MTGLGKESILSVLPDSPLVGLRQAQTVAVADRGGTLGRAERVGVSHRFPFDSQRRLPWPAMSARSAAARRALRSPQARAMVGSLLARETATRFVLPAIDSLIVRD